MSEIWKPIPDFPGYFVSNQGNVGSAFKRISSPGQEGASWIIEESVQRVLKPSVSKYRGVHLRKDGKGFRKRVGVLVLSTFIGPCPEGMECCHNNGNGLDDRLANLRWGSHESNMQDAARYGVMKGARKLTEQQAKEIRQRFNDEKITRKELAIAYEVSSDIICDILSGRTYRNVGGPLAPPGHLTDEQAELIRRERASGRKLIDIANEFNMSESGVSRIVLGNRKTKAGGPILDPRELIVRV